MRDSDGRSWRPAGDADRTEAGEASRPRQRGQNSPSPGLRSQAHALPWHTQHAEGQGHQFTNSGNSSKSVPRRQGTPF